MNAMGTEGEDRMRREEEEEEDGKMAKNGQQKKLSVLHKKNKASSI